MKEYYFEFEGGLGDILHACFERGEYRQLDHLGPATRARITVFSVNPQARELFAWHPNREFFVVQSLPHWGPVSEQREQRAEHGLPPRTEIDFIRPGVGPVYFYPSPEDARQLARLRGLRYVVFACSAGELDRIVPQPIIDQIARILLADEGLHLVRLGRNYADQRCSRRFEPLLPPHERVIDLADRLSVPGTAIAVAGAVGAVCSHSAVSLLAWNLDRPELLLYPESVYRRCFVEKRDGYTIFGVDRPTTRHTSFDCFTPQIVSDFAEIMKQTATPSAPEAQGAA